MAINMADKPEEITVTFKLPKLTVVDIVNRRADLKGGDCVTYDDLDRNLPELIEYLQVEAFNLMVNYLKLQEDELHHFLKEGNPGK